jgi:hypothetical protein
MVHWQGALLREIESIIQCCGVVITTIIVLQVKYVTAVVIPLLAATAKIKCRIIQKISQRCNWKPRT